MRKIIFSVVLFMLTVAVKAQNIMEQTLPNDPNIRIGKLDNGMTYYVAKNSKPENMANFFIVHNVGAMQESDHQNGLAHFLEHMAFNGTKNFPDKKLLQYLESIGVQFGYNINAYTSQEETVYMLMDVPMTRQTIIDSALLVLNDWSHYISLDGEEIDKERGVIIEELRTGMGAQRRIFNKIAPVYFNNTKFADRLIIGTEEILKNFKYEDIRTFYHDWYRTDNQAVIAVGDFDVDKVEAQIKELFSKIPAVENAQPIAFTPIPKYEKDVVTVVTDPEQTSNLLSIMTPIESLSIEKNNTVMAQVISTCYGMMTSIINERLAELSQSPDAKFSSASVGVDSRTRHSEMFSVDITPKGLDFEPAIEAVVAEIVRVRKFGFSNTALERVKANMLKANEQRYTNRESRKNSEIVNIAMSNFMSNKPILEPEYNYKFTEQLINSITLDMLNSMVGNYMPEMPSALIVASTEKDFSSINTDNILKAYQNALKFEVEELVDEKIDRPLIGSELKPGKIKSETTDKYGDTVWKLANGATVVLRTTDYKKDELIFSGYKPGGMSLVSDKDITAASMISEVASLSGIGDFNASDLRKVLAGKSVSMRYGINNTKTDLSGRSSVSDAETLLKLFYLNYTTPRFTDEDLGVFKKKFKVQFENISMNPMVAFYDSLFAKVYDYNPRYFSTTKSINEYDKIEVEQLKAIHKTVFEGVDGAKFYFVGNITKEQLKPLVEKYIASLPKGKATPFVKGVTPEFVKGDDKNIFTRKQENPKASVGVAFNITGLDYTLENMLAFDALKHILDIRYIEVIREEKGATYGVSVMSRAAKEPNVNFLLMAMFDTNGDVALEMSDIISSEIQKIADNGPLDSDLQKAKEVFAKNFKNAQIENGSWMGWVKSLNDDGIDHVNDYEKELNALNSEHVKAMAKRLIENPNRVKVIMMP